MGFLDKLKNFAGGHGVTVTLVDLDGDTPDQHAFAGDSTTLRGTFRVESAESEAVVLKHYVVLRARVSGGEPTQPTELGRIDFPESYTVVPDEPRDFAFELLDLEIAQATEHLGLSVDALWADPTVKLELTVLVDVKGSPVDPSATHTIRVMDPAEAAALAAKTAPFTQRLEMMLAALREIPDIEISKAVINPPATEEEIATFVKTIGFTPSEAFLDYYRSANGAEIEWFIGEQFEGGFTLRPIQDITQAPQMFGWDFYGPGEDTVPILGGLDQHFLRSNLMQVDDRQGDGNGYPTVGLFCDAERAPEPVVIFSSDAAACLTDSFPMKATSYFEMLLATAGYSQMIREFPGASGQKSWTIEWSREDWGALGGGAEYVSWLLSRGDVFARYAPAMSKLQDTLRSGETSSSIDPKKWIELRYGVAYSTGETPPGTTGLSAPM